MHTDVLKLLRLQLMSLLTLNTLLFLSTTQNYISHYTRYTTYSMDQMPVATRSDCTQVDLTEVWKMDYNGHRQTNISICRGRNGRNNDLWAYAARL